ncbi:MAG: adenylate/guanylate cyclase domain-containing protein [Burkholderiaceae bacterium]|nr:adenylate/guanylate cyclase domain-containing protein [Burkholderiaceae bacterium]
MGLVLTLLACAYLINYLPSETLDRMETSVADLRMRLEKPELDPQVVIVDIDSKSLTEVGRFPWSRNHVADLVRQLTEKYKVRVIGFDVSFPEPDTSSGYGVLQKLAQNELKQVPGLTGQLQRLEQQMDYDGLLAAAMKDQPVVLGYNLSGTQTKGVLPAPAFTEEVLNGRELTAIQTVGFEANIERLQEAAATAGSFSVVTDPDGVVRSTALLQKVGKGYYTTLSLATVAVATGATAINPIFEDTVDTLSDSQKAAGGVDKIAMFTPEGNRLIPVGEALTTTVQFRGKGGPDGGAFRYVSAVDVIRGTVPQDVLEGAIVLVGTTAPGLNDLRATPVSAEYPGVEIHANIIKSILDDQFKVRPADAFVMELMLTLMVGLVLAFALPALSPLWSVLLSLAVLGAAAAVNFYMYSQFDTVLKVAVILLLGAVLFVFNVAWGYFFEVRRGQALVSRFGEYVAPELVAEMAEDPAKYNMDGESRELTVLFVDVRGFTTISEGLTPKQLREYINIYLTAMSKDIRDYYRGTLDKYIGDAVMAFWGAPVAFPDHASRGVATALKMQESAHKLNDDFIKRGWPELKIGIGLNSGPMHVGDMGSEIRRAYTVMGDAVNLGSRLEGITKVYGVGICVGEVTRHAASEFAYRELDLVKVKGKNEPVAIFEPVALDKELSESDRAEITRWNDALALVRRQQWDAAQALLESLNAAHPRGLYTLYLERIAIYREQPPGEDWDGVTKFETK